MKPNVSCKDCSANDWQIKLRVNLNKGIAFPYCCRKCGYISPVCESHENVIRQITKYNRFPEALRNV